MKKGASASASMRRWAGSQRMKIGIGDSDIPRNEAMRANLDLLLDHDERAVKQSEISDGATSFGAHGKRAAGVNRNVVPDDERARIFVAQKTENLRGLAIKTFAEFDIRWNRVVPPIAFDMSIWFDVAHEG